MHYTVLVIGDDVVEQMAPFQENNMGDAPSEYLEFEDETEEFQKEYREGSVGRVKTEEGELVSPHDERFFVAIKEEGYPENPPALGVYLNGKRGTYVPPEHLERVQVFHKDRYPTFEEFMEEIYPETPREGGKYGFYYNPDAEWDWWVEGGRWKGLLVGRDGGKHDTLKAGRINWSKTIINSGYCLNREFVESCEKTGVPLEDHPPAALIENCRGPLTTATLKDGNWEYYGDFYNGVYEKEDIKMYFDLLFGLPVDTKVTVVDWHI